MSDTEEPCCDDPKCINHFPAPPDERCAWPTPWGGVCGARHNDHYPESDHQFVAPAPLADGGKTVFDGYPLSRAEYVERIHEGGRGGYGIATHDVLMHHDAALRAALDKAKEALMKIRDGIDGEYIATQRGVAIAARALAELEGK